jgi:hypothetical protein
LTPKVRQARTHQLHWSNQGRRDLSLHLLVAHFLDCTEQPVGGVADDDIDASKSGECRINFAANPTRVRQIHDHDT